VYKKQQIINFASQLQRKRRGHGEGKRLLSSFFGLMGFMLGVGEDGSEGNGLIWEGQFSSLIEGGKIGAQGECWER